MNIGAYIIICGVGAALMIIGFWIGYAWRATHKPDITPEQWERVRQVLREGFEVQKKILSEPIKGRSHNYQIFDDMVNEDSKIERTMAIDPPRKSVGSIHGQMEKDLAAGRTFPDPYMGTKIDPAPKDPKDAPKV